jgi:Family of unknown function (DUF6104)
MISACCAAKLRPSISSRLNRPRHRGTEGRRGDGQVSLAWLAERLRDFVDLNPDFETSIDRLATWPARLDNDEDLNPFPRTGSGASFLQTGNAPGGIRKPSCPASHRLRSSPCGTPVDLVYLAVTAPASG